MTLELSASLFSTWYEKSLPEDFLFPFTYQFSIISSAVNPKAVNLYQLPSFTSASVVTSPSLPEYPFLQITSAGLNLRVSFAAVFFV